MKEFIDRLRNISQNVSEGLYAETGKVFSQDSADIESVVKDMQEYELPGMTKQQYEDVQLLTTIAERQAKDGDGLDRDFVEAIQAAQKILFVRAGSKSWQHLNKA